MIIEVVKKELIEDDTWYNDTYICFVNASDCQSENIYCLTVSYEKLDFGDAIKTVNVNCWTKLFRAVIWC